MIDDTTLDKPYRWAIELVRRHWSGTPHRVVVGLTLIRTRWTDGEAHLPSDVNIADPAHDGVTTNEHVQAMVTAAAARGCQPHLLGYDRWSARVAHVTLVHPLTWQWLTQLNAHCLADPDGSGKRPIRTVRIPRYGAIVHLTGYGFSNRFTMAPPAGGIADWATAPWGCALPRVRRTQFPGGASQRISAVSRSAAAACEPSTAPLVPSGIIAAWLAVPPCRPPSGTSSLAYRPVVVCGHSSHCAGCDTGLPVPTALYPAQISTA